MTVDEQEILRLRSEAQAAFAAQDAEILRMHVNALAALRDPAISENIRLEALLRTREWVDRGTVSEDYVRAWREVLAMDDEEAAAAILADTDEACALRRTTPFSHRALIYPARG